MKWMIASDLHGSAYYCRRLLDAWDREGAERLILLGDLLYHGPRNPQTRDYAPMEVAELLNARREKITGVRGNCDSDVDQMVLEFPMMADYALLPAGSRTVFVTHGHLFNQEHLPPLGTGDILLHGHTHVACCVEGEGYVYMNPGSLSLPKEDTWQGYMLLEGDAFTWKDLDGNVKLTYTVE